MSAKSSKKRIENYKVWLMSFLQEKGSLLIAYTKNQEPVTIVCAGCLKEFTYSTCNNLIKRNPDCFCESCLENKRALESIQDTISFFEQICIPLFQKNNIKIGDRYPISREDSFLGFCGICGEKCTFPRITDLLFKLRREISYKPICEKCMYQKIGKTRIQHTHPSFLKKMRILFKERKAKLINTPTSTKDDFVFRCSKCKKESIRHKFDYFRKEKGNYICVECSMKKAGKMKRLSPIGVLKRNHLNRVQRNSLFEYYNNWTNKIKKKNAGACIISGETKNLVAHHIYGFTRYPCLGNKLLNGVCLSSEIHKEFHSRYGRANKGYFDFKEFFLEKTGREFYLFQQNNVILDIVFETQRLLEKKRTFFCSGINYIPIWEYELFEKADILESLVEIKAGLFSSKIFARDCQVVEIPKKEAREFLIKHHRQGFVRSSICLGLKHPDLGLVSVMTFGKSRFAPQYEYELLRFCSSLKTVVVGGANKLFHFFLRKYSPKNVISYCDIRFSSMDPNKTMYPKLGFKFLHSSKPNYFYYKDYKAYSRIHFQKHKLPELLDAFDPNKTEKENMLSNGYSLLEDCGNHVFIFS